MMSLALGQKEQVANRDNETCSDEDRHSTAGDSFDLIRRLFALRRSFGGQVFS